jgi:hypothetical protein
MKNLCFSPEIKKEDFSPAIHADAAMILGLVASMSFPRKTAATTPANSLFSPMTTTFNGIGMLIGELLLFDHFDRINV